MSDNKIDWKTNMLIFMKVVGEAGEGDWYAELWETYGISKKDAIHILEEYEKAYPEDVED